MGSYQGFARLPIPDGGPVHAGPTRIGAAEARYVEDFRGSAKVLATQRHKACQKEGPKVG